MTAADVLAWVGTYAALFCTTAVASGVGAYFGSYLKKKGENLATHEDIDKLVEQMKAVTEATKKIEADISTGVWNKQKRWKMKREVLFDAAKRLTDIDNALLSYATMKKEDEVKRKAWKTVPPLPADQLAWAQMAHEPLIGWKKAAEAFDETRTFVTVVCSRDAAKTFQEVGVLANAIAAKLATDTQSYDNAKTDLFKKLIEAEQAIRKELEVDA